LLKPRKLQPGDRVATVSLSWGGAGTYPHRYEAGKRQLQDEFGLQVVEMPHTLCGADWLSRNPRTRAEDLMLAFSDDSIKAVISTIGGDDSIHILPYLDLEILRSNPKIFQGYSDSTIAHLACLKAGLMSFYGPSIMAGFAENSGLFPYMVDSVRRIIFSSAPIGEILPNASGWTVERLDWANPAHQSHKRKLNPTRGWNFLQGCEVHRGHLIGGCIEVLDWLRGTNFWPETSMWRGAILYIETSEDKPTPDDVIYYLRTYAALGILNSLAGILFGRPGGGVPVEQFEEYDQAIHQVVDEEEGLGDLPVITQMDFGHTDPMFVLPYGIQAEIDCERQKFSILESAVTD
jgi:muramoyltetrapeptide carboxypeptidase LdcA involved in peptidoglycan recycling